MDKSAKVLLESVGNISLSIIPIPVLGTILKELLIDLPTRVEQERINSFVESLRKRVNQIEKHEYIKTENFYDLTREVFFQVFKTKSKEKHDMFSLLYINFINNNIDIDVDYEKIFLDLVEELRPTDLQILLYIRGNSESLTGIASYQKFYDMIKNDDIRFNDVSKDLFKLSIVTLENKTLITTEGGLSDFNDKSSYMVFEGHVSSSVRLTEIGDRFINFISPPHNQTESKISP